MRGSRQQPNIWYLLHHFSSFISFHLLSLKWHWHWVFLYFNITICNIYFRNFDKIVGFFILPLLFWGSCRCWKASKLCHRKGISSAWFTPSACQTKIPWDCGGITGFGQKTKTFPPFSLPVLPRKTQMTNIWMTKHFNTWVEFCEMKARWRKSCHISGGVIEGNTWRTLAQWPPENRPEPI